MLFEKKIRVGVGISGGVDSALSAYLLKKKNYEVIGFFMQNWDSYLNGNNSSKYCNQINDWRDALSVANYIGIKIYKIDFIEEYWSKVFLKFLYFIKKGMTPNPDILCNSSIKFDIFFNYILTYFFLDFVSTGHYAEIRVMHPGSFYLLKPNDKKKDQTYFLCRINRDILKKIIFPLSCFNKKTVRIISSYIDLPVAKKKDSTGICFIGENKFKYFISDYFPKREGKIINIEDNKIIGKHEMLYYLTIGQRRGLKISGKRKPYYVVRKDLINNVVYVSDKTINNYLIYSNWCFLDEFSWLIDIKNDEKFDIFSLSGNFLIQAKLRYQQSDIPIKIIFLNNDTKKFKIFFFSKQLFVTIGQYAVLYYRDICLGGGMIIETESNFNLKKKY